MMTYSREQLAWAAGLWEGEGCFTLNHWHSRSKDRTYSYPRASLESTDRDVLEHLQATLGLGQISGPKLIAGRKPIYAFRIDGFEKVQALVAMFWPWLGERRRARAAEVLRETVTAR